MFQALKSKDYIGAVKKQLENQGGTTARDGSTLIFS